jgi:hypothetical protein
MQFFIYRIEPSGHHRLLKPVELAGSDGPLAQYVRTSPAATLPKDQEGTGWHLTESRLLGLLVIPPTIEHAVLCGMRPPTKSFVEMYRLLDLWGFSYRNWTPVTFRLRQLTDENSRVPDPTALTRGFKIQSQAEPVVAFLQLNGGLVEGTWSWGATRSSNRIVLPPEALEFFLSSLAEGSGEDTTDLRDLGIQTA